MMKRLIRYFAACCTLFLFSAEACAQAEVRSPKLVAGGVLENLALWSAKLNGYALLEADRLSGAKLNAYATLAADIDLWATKLSAYVVMTGEFNLSLTEITTAIDALQIYPAGGGGGGAAGIFGNGEDGDNADFDGTGGYGGAADSFLVARQIIPGAAGNLGTEWDGVTGSGSGGAGGNYSLAGIGQNGGDGGLFGGGGGGGGSGTTGVGLGGTGGDGIIWIQYRSTSTGLWVTVTLSTAAGTWTVPPDWNENDNKLAMLGAGGCGADGSTLSGGNGGFGGDAVGGINIAGLTPGVGIAYDVNTGLEACSGTSVQTIFGDWAAGSGQNGGGSGGGGSSVGSAGSSFTFHAGLGGPGGTLRGLTIIPNSGGLHPWQPLTHW